MQAIWISTDGSGGDRDTDGSARVPAVVAEHVDQLAYFESSAATGLRV